MLYWFCLVVSCPIRLIAFRLTVVCDLVLVFGVSNESLF